MSAAEFVGRLEGVRSRGTGKWSARCPAHPDRSPSLSIREEPTKLLLFCWAGCSIKDIMMALRLEMRDLFFDALELDPRKRKAATLQREAERRGREREARKLDRLVDACREAERFLSSRQPVDISAWGEERLSRELNLIADAFRILEADPYVTR